MSLWDDFTDAVSDAGDAIADAADTAAQVVEDTVNAVADAAGDAVETAGNAVADALGAIAHFIESSPLGEVPVLGWLTVKALRWLADVISSATDYVASVIKGTLGAVAGVIGGLIRVVVGGIGGLLAGDGRVFVKGVGDIAAAIGGWVVVSVGKFVGLVQSSLFLQDTKRPLTREELEDLRRVFRGSVALYNVRVVPGSAGLFSVNSRPFTLGNTIYMKGVDPTAQRKVLVHECTHVWQFQHQGSRYVIDALGAQSSDNGYHWQEELADGATRWQDFNAEAEGKFIEDVYAGGSLAGVPPTGKGEFYDDDPVGPNARFVVDELDFTALARDSIAYVRSASSWRFSNKIRG
jgi:hypothetical protein